MESLFALDFAEKFPNGKPIYGSLTGAGSGMFAFQLTSAQLLALNTTAVQVVPSPSIGAGFQLYPTALYLEYVFGGTAYTIGGTTPVFQIEYTGKAVALISITPTGLVDQAASTCGSQLAPVAAVLLAKTNCNNLGLEIKLGGTSPTLTLGNGLLNLVVGYDIVTLF